MVFSSLIFLYVFLPVCIALYYVWQNRVWQNWVLIVASLIFYAWGEPVWVVLLVLSSLVDYLNGLWIARFRGKAAAKLSVVCTLIFNLGILAIFKYQAFFIHNLNLVSGLSIPVPEHHLPIGISFYTFQTISYVIDVYRDEVPAQKDFSKFLLFVSLFHQLVAGPIVRYKDIAYEIENRIFSWNDFSYGVSRFAVGLAKKVVLANPAGEIAGSFLDGSPERMSVLGSWWGILLFTFQIYFDFSGYSDMAIGLGKMFGFTYKENFNYPYLARSATDFWRRWHISLSSFFRDYVYIPLGGNRTRPLVSLTVVWFLTGLWHGASWNFVVWGLFYGVLILFERAVQSLTGKEIPRIVGHPYAILATLVGWTLFYFTDLGHAFAHLGRMFGVSGASLTDPAVLISIRANVFFLGLLILACFPVWPFLAKLLRGDPVEPGNARLGVLLPFLNLFLVAFSTVLLVGRTYNPFLYFRF